MEVGSPSRLTDRSEVFLPESSWRVSNLSAQFPGEAMPSRAPHALILTARRGAGQVSQTLVSGHIAWVILQDASVLVGTRRCPTCQAARVAEGATTAWPPGAGLTPGCGPPHSTAHCVAGTYVEAP